MCPILFDSKIKKNSEEREDRVGPRGDEYDENKE